MEIVIRNTTYKAIRQRINSNEFRQTQIPVERYISLPIPTIFHGINAFVVFTCPVVRENAGTIYSKPDLWWAISADSEKLVYYSLTSIHTFSHDLANQYPIHFEQSLQEIRTAYKELDMVMDKCIAGFFGGEILEQPAKDLLNQLFTLVTPKQIQSIYYQLAPDFFDYLKKTHH